MRILKRLLKWLLCAAALLLCAVLVYVSYVFIAYHRIGDGPLTPSGSAEKTVSPGEPLTLVSWNIGFGAYESDYGFFMDGGTESRAWSAERLDTNLKRIAALLGEQSADFVLLQEVDIDSDRTYHFDEREYMTGVLTAGEWQSVFAQNYDSPYLFYPFTKPHGASKSGLMTFSRAGIASAVRVELPVETGVTKLLDLDRCYSVSRIPMTDGGDLVLYNLHLSAYTSDGTIAAEQLKLLLADMQREYEAGNRCVAAGDFNKDLLGDSSRFWGKADREYTWAQPVPAELFDGLNLTLAAPLDEASPVPSCRNADSAYHEGQYVLTVDGFIVSDNVTVLTAEVLDTGFAYSDHNPVRLTFSCGE